MEYITKKDLIDCSTPDEFCFSLCCMECKTVWKSTPIRFSKAGKKPENENRKIIYDTLYDREKNLAFQKALNQAKESLLLVKDGINLQMPEDLLTIDLMNAYEELGKITGEAVEEDLVNEIFSKFCMGKK